VTIDAARIGRKFFLHAFEGPREPVLTTCGLFPSASAAASAICRPEIAHDHADADADGGHRVVGTRSWQ
jgi:hypothetical protein